MFMSPSLLNLVGILGADMVRHLENAMQAGCMGGAWGVHGDASWVR